MPLAATGSVDGSIAIWDVSTLRLRHAVSHDDAVTKLQWHANTPLFTSVSADRTVRCWDGRTGAMRLQRSGHQDTILDLAVSRDGTRIVTASDDGTCLVFKGVEP
ncbi:angio-associated migratory cell-like protein [Blyttiomyces helicus]|uniref:Angio-associated migratory cell-like protein n=1 Tax=Blyttiomyces helicus TaxID=388810 RepID=A0A4P9VZW3_9FUNG|nr:angio-associated migratory cell-like protein [Blyttiomyces helicus]|eukprot:RKO85334.1 angio-associated migratory cell-like protein [Blyttiomyces helicus]